MVNGPGGRRWRMLHTDASEFPMPEDLACRAADAGIELVAVDGHERSAIAAHGAACDGLFLWRARIDDDLLAALPRCRLLARVGAGYDLIDVEAARRRGVMVTYVPDFCSQEMCEQVLLFILAFGRGLPQLMQAAHQHHWLSIAEFAQPRRLAGRTLGLLGFGRSGQLTAEKARTLGLDVLVWTRTPRPEELARVGARAAPFEQALGCDYVSLHLPLTVETRGLINGDTLRHFKPDGVLINVARGAIVDTPALVEALCAGRLAGAALDVVEPAPLPPEHPLWDLPNVLITSHTAGISVEAFHQSFTTALDDTIAVASGRPPAYPVPELRSAVAAHR
jgi:phosphoglycerate dehydrogenase-like enzyme